MTRTLNIGILRCRDSKTFALTPALEAACRQMLISDPRRQSVMEYWTDLTDGYHQFTATPLPWVDVAFGTADAIDPVTGKIHPQGKIVRQTQLAKAKAATQALPGFANLSAFDHFIVLTGPGAAFPNPAAGAPGQPANLFFDGGSEWNGSAVYPLAGASHSFMCHEFGHVLGLTDSDGVLDLSGAAPVDPGYMDPFDIMAAMTFAHSDPTFAGTPVPGWPNPLAMNNMGPAPSRAETHFFFPASTPAQYVKTIVAPTNATPTVRLHAAYGNANATRLVILDPAIPGKDHVGRTYLEYRDAQWWDQGLDTSGTQWDRQGLVVHVLDKRIVPVTTFNPSGVRAFFRGRIPFPLEVDSDLDIVGTPYTVRVTGGDVQGRYIDVKVTTSSILGFEITATGGHATVMTLDSRREHRSTPCGDDLLWGRWETVSTFAFRPMTWGLGSVGSLTSAPLKTPVIHWTVGGVDVPVGMSGGVLHGCQAPEGAFDVKYAIEAGSQTLTLTSAKAGEAYHMPIRARATHELNGVVPIQDTTFASQGSYVGYRPEDVAKLAACLRTTSQKLRVDFKDLVLPDETGPRPNWAALAARLGERARTIGPQAANDLKSLQHLIELASGK